MGVWCQYLGGDSQAFLNYDDDGEKTSEHMHTLPETKYFFEHY